MSNNPSFQNRFKEETIESSSNSSEESHEEVVVHYKGKYSAERLMMMLDKEKLEALEEEFNDHPDGIELHNFVWLMKCAMSVAPEEKAELVLGLYYLFQEIDINGDEHMEWSEFTQYIIDAVMGQQNKERAEDKELTPVEIMELAHSHKSRRYQLSKLIDRNFHGGFLRQVNYYSSLDLISVVEMGGHSIKFFNIQSEVKIQITPEYASSSFVLSMAYSEKEYMLIIAGSDKVFYRYEKENNGFRHLKEDFKTEYTHLALWYFEEQKAWISACDDHHLRHWNMKTGEEIHCFKGHDQIILDVVEILNPLSIASGSLDGNILLWDLSDQKNIGSLSGKHSRGVRSIDYTSEYGGNIVSVGYERDIHVWSPEVTLSKCYTGKLEGHNCPVVSCKFFKGRPICISVDEKGNVRVWDIRQFLCLQIITHEKGKIEVSRLVTITKHDKFIVAGRRLIWYELLKDSMIKTNYNDVVPILVEFNNYYLQFIVLTKYDLRIYDCVTGKLRKIYTDVQDLRTESELSALVLDHRNRICILGDNSGSIRAYNFANGALMKHINGEGRENKLGSEEDEDDVQESTTKNLKKNDDWNSEISALQFCVDDKILIAASWDSTIMLYDMKDIEEVTLLRVMKGGHQGSDITCVSYSPYLSVIASGSSNGIISVWDFEIGKLEGACFGHKRDITTITFLEPYPVMISCSSDGMICLWNIKAQGGKSRFRCLMRLKNISWNGTQDEKTSISVMLNIISLQKGIIRHKRKRRIRQKKNEIKPKEDKNFNLFKTREGEKYVDSDEESAYEWIEDSNLEIIEEGGLGVIKYRPYLYIGDNRGYLKIWSFESLFAKKKIYPLERLERDKPSYNPRRKDIKNAESDVKYWKKESENEELPPIVDCEADILVRECKAHEDGINSIKPIIDPSGLLTCSLDKFLKIWSREGEIWGIINLCSPEIPKKWYFPFDWEAKKQADINKVIEVLSLIDEKVDIDPNSIPAGPSYSQPAKKKKRQKIPKTKQKFTQQKALNHPTAQYDFEDYADDDFEEIGEKSHTQMKKYHGSVADLKKQLDEIDEKRIREYEEPSAKDLVKKITKTRNRLESENRKNEGSKSQNPQKLPKLGSNRIKMKVPTEKNEVAPLKIHKFHSKQDFTDIPEKGFKKKGQVLKRPIIGLGSTGMLSNFGVHKGSGKFKIKTDKQYDVRYNPGESVKMLNRAISSQTLIQSSILSPYTEDLKTLKKKNEIIKELGTNKKPKSIENLKALRNDY